jgi:amidase
MKEPLFSLIRNSEFKAQFGDYLKTLQPGYPRTLDELVAKANEPGSCYLDRSPEKAFALKYTLAHALDLEDPVYLAALNHGATLVKSGTEAVFMKHRLDAIIYPTVSQPASRIEREDVTAGRAAVAAAEPALRSALSQGSAQVQSGRGGRGGADQSALLIPSYSGFPELVVPAGVTRDGLPITISFMGQAYSEPKLLGYGYDFEQATRARVLPRNTPTLPAESVVGR